MPDGKSNKRVSHINFTFSTKLSISSTIKRTVVYTKPLLHSSALREYFDPAVSAFKQTLF